MSLRDPTSKMSKSDLSTSGRIELTDTADEIQKKIRKSVTDSIGEISYDPENRPGISNLISIYSSIENIEIEKIVEKFKNKNTLEFKESLADVLIDRLVPIGNVIQQLRSDPSYVIRVLHENSRKASAVAERNLKEIKNIVGLI